MYLIQILLLLPFLAYVTALPFDRINPSGNSWDNHSFTGYPAGSSRSDYMYETSDRDMLGDDPFYGIHGSFTGTSSSPYYPSEVQGWPNTSDNEVTAPINLVDVDDDDTMRMLKDFNIDEALASLQQSEGQSSGYAAPSHDRSLLEHLSLEPDQRDNVSLDEEESTPGSPSPLTSAVEFDYGYPDPDWPVSFSMMHAFSEGLAIYDRYANKKKRRWSEGYKLYCNAAVAQDLFSRDETRIQRAVHWLQYGFKNTSDDITLTKILGPIDSWRLVHRVAQQLGWSIPRTVRFLARYLSRSETKTLREAKGVSRSIELHNLVTYVCGPVYMRLCGRRMQAR